MSSASGLLRVPESSELARRVVVSALSAQQRARVNDALRGRATIETIDSIASVLAHLRASIDPVDAVILPAVARETSIERIIAEVAAFWPQTAIVIYCDAVTRYSADLRGLTVAGAHQFVIFGLTDEGATFRDAIASARRVCAADWLMTRMSPLVPTALHRMVETVLMRPDRVQTVPDLARELGVHRKTLFNWCERAIFLPPAELIAWSRLMLVAFYLTNSGCTIETIALDLNYPSDNTLRNTMKRYTGLRATEVRKIGGVEAVLDALRNRLDGIRPVLHLE